MDDHYNYPANFRQRRIVQFYRHQRTHRHGVLPKHPALNLLEGKGNLLNYKPAWQSWFWGVTFAGIPGYTYTIQYATDGPSGPWAFLKTATAGTDGLFEVTDGPYAPPPPARYYRTVYP